jgi:hypothetical protein
MYGRRQTNWVGIALGFLVTLLFAAVSAFAVWQYFQMKDLKAQAEAAKTEAGSIKSNAFELRQKLGTAKALALTAMQEDVRQTQERTLKEISELRELPKNEVPSFALVTDISKLSGEIFFANGENGDYIVAYKKSNLSILYRPIEKKIINVGTITVEG